MRRTTLQPPTPDTTSLRRQSPGAMDEEKLILLIREHKELYDVSSCHYNNHQRKESIWQKIAQEMQQPAEACKSRWKTLRDAFQRAQRKNKLNQSKPLKKWRFWDDMVFLLPYVKSKGSKETEASPTPAKEKFEEGEESLAVEVAYSDQEQAESSASLLSDFDFPSNLPSPPPVSDVTTTSMSSRLNLPTKRSSWPLKSKNCDVTFSESYRDFGGGRKRLRSLRESRREFRRRDPTLDFFLNMGETVKTFPPYVQAQVKSKVFEVVNSAELMMLASETQIPDTFQSF